MWAGYGTNNYSDKVWANIVFIESALQREQFFEQPLRKKLRGSIIDAVNWFRCLTILKV